MSRVVASSWRGDVTYSQTTVVRELPAIHAAIISASTWWLSGDAYTSCEVWPAVEQ